MPSRVHYVYTGTGAPCFDAQARIYFQDQIRRKVIDTLGAREGDRIMSRIAVLPRSFRKAIPLLQDISTELGFTLTKKLRKFRLPKHLRRAKNPIISWKDL